MKKCQQQVQLPVRNNTCTHVGDVFEYLNDNSTCHFLRMSEVNITKLIYNATTAYTSNDLLVFILFLKYFIEYQ